MSSETGDEQGRDRLSMWDLLPSFRGPAVILVATMSGTPLVVTTGIAAGVLLLGTAVAGFHDFAGQLPVSPKVRADREHRPLARAKTAAIAAGALGATRGVASAALGRAVGAWEVLPCRRRVSCS